MKLWQSNCELLNLPNSSTAKIILYSISITISYPPQVIVGIARNITNITPIVVQ